MTYLKLHPDVAEAVERRAPIVAFETTILSFGLPRPLNEQVAAECERIARDEGAVPATIALLDGAIHAGLEPHEIGFFCSRDPSIRKVNLQNFAAVLAEGAPGALTVAASMRACAMAGIRVFATGGIGGVHRGYAHTPDISSDLRALAEYPVVVVCAGAKSILDIGATLEALETLGVPVAGFRTRRFPQFYTAHSAHELEISFDCEDELARFVRIHFETAGGGVLVAAPLPPEHAIELDELESWIATALEKAAHRGISGKSVTPFLLECLEQLSGGRTLKANRALIANNARLAARLAVCL
ncbi:MAG: pseudouridine-5'-phosphate glycosidase [Candidatus Sumerlaeota bacterium]|nr:pseudouridine-5'-phosphate glycosidase [Candidatus Sumerlaeota bacterium]